MRVCVEEYDSWRVLEWNLFTLFSVCNIVSAAACTWCVISLIRTARLNPAVRDRVFWRQLLALTLTIGLSSFLKAVVRAANVISNYHGHPLWYNLDVCLYTRHVLVYFRYSACLLEVHIAAGFYAVVYQAQCVYTILRKSVRKMFLLSLCLITLDIYTSGRSRIQHDSYINDDHVWSAVVGGCFVLSAILYVIGAIGVRHLPAGFRRRVLRCALLYSVGVLWAYGPQAVMSVTDSSGLALWLISKVLINLTGAMLVGSYVYFYWPLLGRNTHASFAPEAARTKPASIIAPDLLDCDGQSSVGGQSSVMSASTPGFGSAIFEQARTCSGSAVMRQSSSVILEEGVTQIESVGVKHDPILHFGFYVPY